MNQPKDYPERECFKTHFDGRTLQVYFKTEGMEPVSFVLKNQEHLDEFKQAAEQIK